MSRAAGKGKPLPSHKARYASILRACCKAPSDEQMRARLARNQARPDAWEDALIRALSPDLELLEIELTAAAQGKGTGPACCPHEPVELPPGPELRAELHAEAVRMGCRAPEPSTDPGPDDGAACGLCGALMTWYGPAADCPTAGCRNNDATAAALVRELRALEAEIAGLMA